MGHGDQWDAIYPDFDKFTQHALPSTLANGLHDGTAPFAGEYADGSPHGNVVTGIRHENGRVGYFALVDCDTRSTPRHNEFITAFPIMSAGIRHQMAIDGFQPLDLPMESLVDAVDHDFSLSFFDPCFYRNRFTYKVGEKHVFSLAALAYSLRQPEVMEYDIDAGPLLEIERQNLLKENPNADANSVKSVRISLARMAACFPHKDYPAAYEIRSPVKSVEWFQFEDQDFCCLRVTLVRMGEDADEDFDILLYAASHVLHDYKPQVGDDVEAVIWLQGNLVE
jgi:hypothetical protein